MKQKVRKSKYDVRIGRSASGQGLFTKAPIRKGDFVIEYHGPIISRERADAMGGRYLFEVSERKVINGSVRYNLARYINHSCRPNCETDVVRGKVYIYARRNIRMDEELHYDYGKEYFEEFIEPAGCQCEKCAGRR